MRQSRRSSTSLRWTFQRLMINTQCETMVEEFAQRIAQQWSYNGAVLTVLQE